MLKVNRWVGLFIAAVIILIWWVVRKNWPDSDVRLAVIDDRGITMQTYSWKRRMVNQLTIDSGVEVWVPNGPGWYKAGDIKKLLDQEKKSGLGEGIFFYNFGFVPEKILKSTEEGLSGWRWIRYLVEGSKLMEREEEVDKDLDQMRVKLDEIMPRDFADMELLRDEARVSVFNSSQSNGLANFLATMLGRAGVTVMAVETADEIDKVDYCKIGFGPESRDTLVGGLLTKLWKDCAMVDDGRLNLREIELYFGDKFATMINYQSYVRTF